jgi:hypothetical protein
MNDSIKNKTGIFTVCSICYLSKALVLADSINKYEEKKIIIYLIDKKSSINIDFDFADIRWIEDENIPDFNKLAFIYDVTEFSTCVKPLLTLRLLNSFSYVIYLDPDTCLYNSLKPIYDDLEKFPILLTPHYTTPISSKEDNYDLGMMRWGSFNLGFYAINSQNEAIDFLLWWSERCINLGFAESQFGLSVDQKWVSIAPCFFPNLHVMFNLGLNMAFWNLHERVLSRDSEGYLVNNQYRLVFFHYSSFNLKNPEVISSRPHRWNLTGRDDLNEICTDYADKLAKFDYGFSMVKYGFDYMSNGTYVSPTLRRAYASVADKLTDVVNPFDYGSMISKFISKNYLMEKTNVSYKPANYINVPNHSGKFKLIYFFLRLILRIMGPNNFFNLSRLFVYLSSYRQTHGLWKI